MIIPVERLSPQALNGLIEEFVSREGTDYGQTQHSFAEKCSQVRVQIERGEVQLVFDPDTETSNLVRREELT